MAVHLPHCIGLFADGANGFTASGEAVNAPLAEKPPKDVDDTVSSAQSLLMCTFKNEKYI